MWGYKRGKKYFLSLGGCSHGRSIDYFIESINGAPTFASKQCDAFDTYLAGACDGNSQNVMGFHADRGWENILPLSCAVMDSWWYFSELTVVASSWKSMRNLLTPRDKENVLHKTEPCSNWWYNWNLISKWPETVNIRSTDVFYSFPSSISLWSSTYW